MARVICTDWLTSHSENSVSNHSTGHAAEIRAAKYLEGQGYTIREINWKTKYCEIDIVCVKNQTIRFIEVKYRRNTKHGQGLDYITEKKLEQMKFAAETWVQNHGWASDYQLMVVSIDAEEITVIDDL